MLYTKGMRFILTLLLGLLTAHAAFADSYQRAFSAADKKDWSVAMSAARAIGQNYMMDYIHWRKLRSRDARESAADILNFMRSHPNWPERDRLAQRAAEALLLDGYDATEEQNWHRITGEKRDLFTYAWIEGSYTGEEQEKLMHRYQSRLTGQLYEARADRLLWDNEASRCRPLLKKTNKSFRKIAEARIAYIMRARDSKSKLRSLSRNQQRHPGLLYARIQYHKKKGQHRDAESLLKQLPPKVPYGKQWWPLWRYYAREAIGEHRYRDALAILSPVKQAEPGAQAQLFWLRGWIQLQFLRNPSEAYKDFYIFYKHVGTPISKTRGAFWAGLAAQQNGNHIIARNWYAEAAQYPMTFYGQLAKLQQSRAVVLPLKRQHLVQTHPKALRDQMPLLRKLVQYDQSYSIETFLFNLAERYSRPEQIMAIAESARKMGAPHLAVRLGKQHFGDTGQWLQPVSHPLPSLPRGLAVEPALVLAITRQESEFNPKAKSSASAQGLMQLLPSTAQLVAREQGISHSTSMLNNPQHNMKLGSHYLAGLIRKFDGQYPLAIAAYNAGPGRVSDWLEEIGPFPNDIGGRLKWLEQIPYTETRNYVQRVLENLHTYRALLGEERPLTQQRMFGS